MQKSPIALSRETLTFWSNLREGSPRGAALDLHAGVIALEKVPAGGSAEKPKELSDFRLRSGAEQVLLTVVLDVVANDPPWRGLDDGLPYTSRAGEQVNPTRTRRKSFRERGDDRGEEELPGRNPCDGLLRPGTQRLEKSRSLALVRRKASRRGHLARYSRGKGRLREPKRTTRGVA